MDLVLWRHAQAQEPQAHRRDIDRPLTRRGQQQAKRMAAWLDRQLPEATRIYCSPAQRTQETAQALERKFKLCDELLPGAAAQSLLELATWPTGKGAVLVVGHQPTLGQVLAQVLGLQDSPCVFKKGAVWWLRSRVRDGVSQTVVLAVQTAEML